MPTSTSVPKDSPLMRAWEAHKATDDYANSKGWAMQISPMIQTGDPDGDAKRRFEIMPREQREMHVEGSLWAAFMAGFHAAGDDHQLFDDGPSENMIAKTTDDVV